jgi:hypothetical protein
MLTKLHARFIGTPELERYSSQLAISLQEITMHPAFVASALCLSILVFAVQPAASQTPAASSPPASASAGDAAAKHAKRTTCLKESKARKLVGAEKTAFLKECIGASPEAISASRVAPPDRP